MNKLLQLLGGHSNISKMLPHLRSLQEHLAQKTIESQAEGIRLRLRRNPDFSLELVDINIDKKLQQLPLRELEVRIKTATNNALKKVKALISLGIAFEW
jgi:DNA-binding protein YbaB